MGVGSQRCCNHRSSVLIVILCYFSSIENQNIETLGLIKWAFLRVVTVGFVWAVVLATLINSLKFFLWGIVDTGRLVAFSGNWQCSLVINQSTLRQRMHLPCQPSCRKAVYVKASYLKPPDVPTLKHFLSVVEWLKRQNSLDLSFKSNLCFFHFFSMLMCHSWRFGTIHNYLYIYI